MVTVWWSAAGLIHHSFLNPGKTIMAEKYCWQIDEMHQKLQCMWLRLVNMKGPILLHDNARPHVAQLTLQKLNELGYETLPHPPYSPDLSPTDYHFFKHLDNFLCEKCFKSRDDAKSAFNDFIASRTPDFYANGINIYIYIYIYIYFYANEINIYILCVMVGWVYGISINLCKLFNAKFIFMQIIRSISNNSVCHNRADSVYYKYRFYLHTVKCQNSSILNNSI